MSPTGSDGNNGTSAATPWATPNHAVNCGDVIIAAAGTYSPITITSTPSSCPSTSGGLSASPGGIYFTVLLCGGSDLEACKITNGTGVSVQADYWAVEGFYASGTGGGGSGPQGRSFEVYACSTVHHHVAFINDISANALQGYDTNDCGGSGGQGTIGTDYFAVVGSIAENSAQDTICLAAIDIVGPGVLNTTAGTHGFLYGNFSYDNHNSSCVPVSDTEDMMFDTWDAHNNTNKGVIANNIGYDADRMCIQLFTGNEGNTFNVYNNTCYHDNMATGPDTGADGEINLNNGGGTINWALSVYNNISYAPTAAAGGSGGAVDVAMAAYQTITTFTNGGSGTQNIFKATQTKCPSETCNSTYDITVNTSGNLGTNTYENPAFTNTTDLLANQLGAPNCTGFVNVTECMGYNANALTLTTPSVISDLTPTASGTSGKGYQVPSTTCISSGFIYSDYPTWLKGVVYLHWNGTSLTENADLVTKPCGM